MAAGLNAYLRAARDRPFGYAPDEIDCARFVADFVLMETGRDPLARWRGRYSTEAEARRILADQGGLGAVLSDGLAPILPHDGAAFVGVLGTQQGEIGAIATPHGWAAMTSRGVARMRADMAPVVKTWGRPCRS